MTRRDTLESTPELPMTMLHDQHSESFAWSAHPARERPVAASIAVVVILALGAAASFTFGWMWGGVSVVVLVLSLNRFFLPSRFVMTDRGIVAHYPLCRVERQWQDIRRFLHDATGGYLSTRSRATRMDAFSGMHVLFGRNREEIIAQIRQHLASASLHTHDARQPETVTAIAPVSNVPTSFDVQITGVSAGRGVHS